MSAPDFAVTGATGFIGRALVRELRRRFPDRGILAIGRNRARLEELARDSGAAVIESDLAELGPHAVRLREAEAVFHAGALARFGNGSVYRKDAQNTRALLEVLKGSARLARFIYVSSIGATDRHPDDPLDRPLDGDSPAAPTTDYGRFKLEGEELTRRSGLPHVVVRPAWVYGPGMRGDSHVRVLIEAVGRRAPYTLFDLPGRVSLIYIDDMARALVLLGREAAAAGGTFVCAGDEPIRLGSLFAKIDEHYHGRRPRARIPVPAGIVRTAAGLRRWLPLKAQVLFTDAIACSNRPLRALGFRETVLPAEGLRSMREDAPAQTAPA